MHHLDYIYLLYRLNCVILYNHVHRSKGCTSAIYRGQHDDHKLKWSIKQFFRSFQKVLNITFAFYCKWSWRDITNAFFHHTFNCCRGWSDACYASLLSCYSTTFLILSVSHLPVIWSVRRPAVRHINKYWITLPFRVPPSHFSAPTYVYFHL